MDLEQVERVRQHLAQERALGDARFQKTVETALGRPACCRPRGRQARHDVPDT